MIKKTKLIYYTVAMKMYVPFHLRYSDDFVAWSIFADF